MNNYAVRELKLYFKLFITRGLAGLVIISSSCTTKEANLRMKSEIDLQDITSSDMKTEAEKTEGIEGINNNRQKSANIGKAIAGALFLGSVVANIVLGVEVANQKNEITNLKETIEERVNIIGAAIAASIITKDNKVRLLQSTNSDTLQLFYENIFFNTPNLAELAEKQNWYNIVSRYNSSLNEVSENCTANTNKVSQDINNEIYRYNLSCSSSVQQNKLEQQSLYNNIQIALNNIKDSLSQYNQTCIAPSYKSNNGLCKTCTISNCLQCKDTNINNPTTSCVSCVPGMCSTGSSCISTSLSNCQTCSNSTSCLSCASGFFLNNMACSSCSIEISNCLTCATQVETVVCSKCKEGFWLSPSMTSCDSCSVSIPGCDYCFSDASNITKCATCENGYFLNQNNLCSICSVSNCLSCSISDSICDICDTKNGYWPNTDSTQCGLCENLFQNCKNCAFDPVSLKTICNSCEDGSFLSGNLCTSCDTNCLTCSESASTCLYCDSTQGLFLSSESTCLSCVAVIPNCNLCFSGQNESTSGPKTICLSCEDAYCPNFITNTCDYCDNCEENCQKCTDPNNCLLCSTPYVLQNSSCFSETNCTQSDGILCTNCTAGNYLNTSKSCSPCTLKYCLECSSESMCTKCLSSHYVNTRYDNIGPYGICRWWHHFIPYPISEEPARIANGTY